MDVGVLIVVFCVAVGVALLTPMVLARRRAPQERGLTPAYESIGSGTLGSGFGGNIPMFRLSIYSDFIVICFLRPMVIPVADLSLVGVRGTFFGRRLCIWTRNGDSYQLSVSKPERAAQLLGHT